MGYKAQALAALILTTAFSATVQAQTNVIQYDSFQAPGGYTLADYETNWINPFGPGEMGIEDTRTFESGKLRIDAAPFQTSADFSVFDHIKYFAITPTPVAIPQEGSITFSAEIEAETPGTVPGRIIEGTYLQSGQPYKSVALEGQQACATLHMIDFASGQLFDWLVSGNKALALTERLPTTVTGSPGAGRNEIYTQIVGEFEIAPGPHNYAIRYTRDEDGDQVEFLIDGEVMASYEGVGVPLDNREEFVKYPALGNGELLKDQMQFFTMAHGVFSLLDEFPFQHPDAPEFSVSIPVENRIFGQGVRATYDNFKITTSTKD